MSRAQWWSDAEGHTLTYCCVDAPSRELARIGLLYARNGRWKDRQVLPERWVRDSLMPVDVSAVKDGAAFDYGYQWYIDFSMFHASGFDSQWIYVIPGLDLIVVRHGHYDKYPGPPIADPSLFEHYPAAGLVPGLGTIPPDGGWNMAFLLDRIFEAVIAR